MIQKLKKPIDHSLPTSPPSSPSLNLNQLILSDPILLDYFQNNSRSTSAWQLAHDLMLDGLRYRANGQRTSRPCCCLSTYPLSPVQQKFASQPIAQNPAQEVNGNNEQRMGIKSTPPKDKDKQYNVSYIKHNRFLSPNQRKQIVTPKVTEVIPMKGAGPLVIYGKPRVKIDEECGCPYHNNEEECHASTICMPSKAPPKVKHELHIKQSFSPDQLGKEYNKISKFKSSPNLHELGSQMNEDFHLNKTKKNGNNTKIEKNTKLKREIERESDQIVYVDNIIQVESRVPGKMRIVRLSKGDKCSPQPFNQMGNSQYEKSVIPNSKQVESKIKFLIERDKKSKDLQKGLKRQEKQIKILEKLIKKDKKVEVPLKKTIKITSKDILSLSSDSSQIRSESSARFGQEGEQCNDCSKTFSQSSSNQESEEFSEFNRQSL